MKKSAYLFLFLVSIIVSNIALADSLDDILANKKLRVAFCNIAQAPFYYKESKTGNLVGADIDIAKSIAEELGVELEIIQERDSWDDLIEDVANNKADLAISYISLTPKRALKVEFSEPYAKVRPVFLINRTFLASSTHSGHDTLSQMFNSDNSEAVILAYDGSSYLDQAKHLFPKAKIHPIHDLQEVENMLLTDQAAAYFSDEVEISSLLRTNPEYKLKLIAYSFKNNADIIAIPVKRENTKLLSYVNSVLKVRNVNLDIQTLINVTDIEK